MRGTPARVLAVLALGAAVASTTACLPGIGGGDTKAACDNMKTELAGISSKAQGMISNPTALSQVYTDAANNIRAEGAKAGGDVEAAGNTVATDLEGLANTLRQAASGNPQMPDANALISSSTRLKAACE
ncbi:hypothetical protein [Actinomadura sp. HBU206391]|uniref:hypothetical protein n=1 Tax=Actinomadura sp. HBU206391 TaxID=2731692 RepID=UPI001650624B|nr:hypothetical protein [Actinomadura sp. HBU206391]MBC6462119.1 hypothetical protein [Actinomadura sp. HBU206391]